MTKVKIFFAGWTWIVQDMKGVQKNEIPLKTGKKLIKYLNDNKFSLSNKDSILPEFQAQLKY